MDVKKLTFFAVIVFLIFFVVTSPDLAASVATTLWNGLDSIFHGISEFIQNLSGGSSA